MENRSSYRSEKRVSRNRSAFGDKKKGKSNKNGSSSKHRIECSHSGGHHKKVSMRRMKSLYWDVPPRGYADVTPAEYKQMLKNGLQIEDITPCTRQILVPVLSASVTRQARRLYVGNIPFGCTEDEMLQFFNGQMHMMGLSQASGNPVLACQINVEKNFAFIELRSIDETTQAMALDNICFKGLYLKMRRPHDYHPLPGEIDKTPASLPMTPVVPVAVSNLVPDSPHKIFIGGLPNFLTEEQLKEVLQTFGTLRGFNLIKDSKTGLNKGYAFCEYIEPSVTSMAILSLNGITIGDRKISVQRAISCPRNSTDTSIKSGKPKKDDPTEILCLHNMVSFEDLKDDEEIADIMSDVREECQNFGNLRSIQIPRPTGDQTEEGWGKIFVQFSSASDCQKAQAALSGRKFNGRIVLTSYYDLKKFERQEFT